MKCRPGVVSIFIRPSSIEELQRRLRRRGTETDEAIRRRLEQANHELSLADRYHYLVINDDVDRAVQQTCDILTQESEADRNAR